MIPQCKAYIFETQKNLTKKSCLNAMCGSKGGGGGGGGEGSGPPLKNHNLAILVRIPWKSTKLPSQHSMLGQHRLASEMSLTDDGPLTVVFGSFLPSSIKKKRCHSWTPSGKTFWIRTWMRRLFWAPKYKTNIFATHFKCFNYNISCRYSKVPSQWRLLQNTKRCYSNV